MPFLTINGWEIPVAEVTKSIEYLGSYKRVFNGSLRDSTSAVKRKWNITTIPLSQEDAKTLRLILTSAGDHWGFDNLAGIKTWDRTINNFWISDKGLDPLQGTSTYRPREGPNGLNAVALEKATTNILPNQDTASFENEYGNWTRSFEILSSSNESRYQGGYHGSYCYRLVGSSTSGTKKFGMTTDFITELSDGEPISFSWYEKHNISLTSVSGSGNFAPPAIVFYDDSDVEVSRVELTNLGVATTEWHRHSISTAVPSGATKCKVRYGFESSLFSSYYWIQLDAFQLEKKPRPTSFAYLTRSSDSTVVFSGSHLYTAKELSLLTSFLLEEKPSSSYYIIFIYTPSWTVGYTFQLYISTTTLYFRVHNPIVGDKLYTLVSNYSEGVWYNIGISFSSSKVKCYVNGEKKVDSSTNYELWYDSNASIYVPNYSISLLVSNLLILPYAVSESFLAQATSSNIYYKMPYVAVSGDMVDNQTVYCFPEISEADYLQYSNNGVWTTGQKVKFSLLEV